MSGQTYKKVRIIARFFNANSLEGLFTSNFNNYQRFFRQTIGQLQKKHGYLCFFKITSHWCLNSTNHQLLITNH